MDLVHDRNKLRVYECPACRERFTIGKSIFFPREIWHPFRTYDFLKGRLAPCCGYLISNKQLEAQHGN